MTGLPGPPGPRVIYSNNVKKICMMHYLHFKKFYLVIILALNADLLLEFFTILS